MLLQAVAGNIEQSLPQASCPDVIRRSPAELPCLPAPDAPEACTFLSNCFAFTESVFLVMLGFLPATSRVSDTEFVPSPGRNSEGADGGGAFANRLHVIVIRTV